MFSPGPKTRLSPGSVELVDPADAIEIAFSTIREPNPTFGGHFIIVSFRWFNPSEV